MAGQSAATAQVHVHYHSAPDVHRETDRQIGGRKDDPLSGSGQPRTAGEAQVTDGPTQPVHLLVHRRPGLTVFGTYRVRGQVMTRGRRPLSPTRTTPPLVSN